MTQQQIDQAIKQLSDHIDEIGDWDLQNLKRKITDELEKREKGMVNSIKEMIQLAEQGRTTFCYYLSLPGKSTVSESTVTKVLEQIRKNGALFELDGEIWEVQYEIEYSKKQSWSSKGIVCEAKFYVLKRTEVQKL